jgi:hypothetical protein
VFQRPFTLNKDIGELPAGSYELEIDEDEIETAERTVHVRVAAHLFVRNHRSTRMVVVNFDQLANALANDGVLNAGK